MRGKRFFADPMSASFAVFNSFDVYMILHWQGNRPSVYSPKIQKKGGIHHDFKILFVLVKLALVRFWSWSIFRNASRHPKVTNSDHSAFFPYLSP